MSFNAAALKIMADKGLSAHDIAEVAAANERSADSTADRRRAWDRQRKADKREEVKSGGMSGGSPPDPSPNEVSNLTPTRERKPEPKGSVKKRCPIPDDWQPVEFEMSSESRKVVDSWPPGELPAQVEQFKAHHRSKRNTFIDPQDAWSTWVLNTRKWGIGKHERSGSSGADGFGIVVEQLQRRYGTGG